MVTSRCPWPANSGAERRVYQHLMMLRGHFRVVLVTSSVGIDGVDAGAVDELRDIVDNLVVVPPSRLGRVNTLEAARLAPLQVIRVANASLTAALRAAELRYTSVCSYYSLIRTGPCLQGRQSPALLDYCDALSLQFARKARYHIGAWRAIYKLEAHLLKHYERRLGAQVDAACVTSPTDQQHLLPTLTTVLPNAFDMREPRSRTASSRMGKIPGPLSVVFTGDMSTRYSEDAAVWFAKNVLLLIKASVPEVDFWIVGREPTVGIQQLARDDPGVHVTGAVDAVSAYLDAASVAVVPLLYGTGIKTKILDAFARSVPVVATTIADDGIWGARDGALVVADTASEMAEQTIALLKSPARRVDLGARGKAFGEAHYSGGAVANALLGCVDLARKNFTLR